MDWITLNIYFAFGYDEISKRMKATHVKDDDDDAAEDWKTF